MCGITTWNVILCACVCACEHLITVFKLGPGMFRSVVNQMLNRADVCIITDEESC